MNEQMNKLYFTRVVEKTQGLFTSREKEGGRQSDRDKER